MKPYSNDLRYGVVEVCESGLYTCDEVAELFGLCTATIRNFLSRKRQTGSADALAHAGGRTTAIEASQHEQLRQIVEDNDDATLTELCQLIEYKLKKQISPSALCRLLQAMNLPRKKSRFTPVSVTRRGSSKPEVTTGKK